MYRDGDGLLQLLILNEEFLVSQSHQLGLITSLPFVHTARRSYRLSVPVKYLDCINAQCVSLVNKHNEPYHLEEGQFVLTRLDRPLF
jgi:hypothetical protein